VSSRAPLNKAPAAEKPSTAEELAKRLHEAAKSKSAVVPVGGRRASGMGGAPARCDVELHTTRLDRVLEHSAADMVVSVEAGITLEAVQAELAKDGQFLPLDPFNSPGHTIGGLIATGWSGPLRQRFGSARDFLIGIRVALPDGRLASAGGRVVKNVSGYDLMKLHYGAMGSLGVIVAASFKVYPRPMHDVTVSSTHASMDDAFKAAEDALAMPLPPAALELFSDRRVLARFFGSPDAVNRMVEELGRQQADATAWTEHSRRGPQSWVRVSVPRHALRGILAALPRDASWWASPGTGIAHWSFGDELQSVGEIRGAAERAQGSLVVMAAPTDVAHRLGAWGTTPATIQIMRTLKRAFDPDGILNPGRFVV
jgi:FAD/FMN-containing dehydrogenase